MTALDITAGIFLPGKDHCMHFQSHSMSISDLQKDIQHMLHLFPESTRPSGEEHDLFTVRSRPILEQMNALQISSDHRPAPLFLFITGKARKAAFKVSLSSATIESFFFLSGTLCFKIKMPKKILCQKG